ncbi:MAG: hypothetical protein DRJ03_00365 [Chloroflexi bacterium]|nr:MAG: hypothetical protein DRJ03_00365 [Chloroflexota bacterium]
MAEEFSKGFVLYKAKGDGNGAASQWNLGSQKDCVFLEMANQKGKDDKGNARFDWDNKIRFKLGEADIGEILAVLVGLQDGVGPFDTAKSKHKGLFHSNQSGNAILYFGKDEHGRFRIYLSVKRGDEKTVVQHAMSKGEACVLSTLLRRAVEVMYRWC